MGHRRGKNVHRLIITLIAVFSLTMKTHNNCIISIEPTLLKQVCPVHSPKRPKFVAMWKFNVKKRVSNIFHSEKLLASTSVCLFNLCEKRYQIDGFLVIFSLNISIILHGRYFDKLNCLGRDLDGKYERSYSGYIQVGLKYVKISFFVF